MGKGKGKHKNKQGHIKNKDPNRKGAKKKGMDMDAFLDNVPSAKVQTEQPKSGKQGTKKCPIPNDKETKSTTDMENKGSFKFENEIPATSVLKIKQTVKDASMKNIPIKTPLKSKQKSPVNDGTPKVEVPSAGQPGDKELPSLKDIEQTAAALPQGGKIGVQQTQRSPSILTPPLQTPLVQEMGRAAYLQGQLQWQSPQVMNQMRTASLINCQTPTRQQSSSGFRHSGGQGVVGAHVVGMQELNENGCQSTGPYPYPGTLPMPPVARYMQGHMPSNPLHPYQQPVYAMNNQMQSLQFHHPPQGYQSYQNPSIYPPHQPIFLTQNFYGNLPGPTMQHPGYFQPPQGPQINLNWSRPGAVGGATPPVESPLTGGQTAPVVQGGSIQQAPQPHQPMPLMSFRLGQTDEAEQKQKNEQGFFKNALKQDIHADESELATMAETSQEHIKELARKQGSQEDKPKSHKPLSITEVISLRKTENAYRPSRLKFVYAIEKNVMTRDMCLYNRVRGVLNKLVLQKFDLLVDQVSTLQIDSQEQLQGVVTLVYHKALREPRFMAMYAVMCKKLSMMQVSSKTSEAGERKKEKKCNVTFGQLIKHRCNMTLERAMSSNPKKKKLTEEERRTRSMSFGNIRFIGELMMVKVLNTNIIHKCLDHLVKQIDDESLECLCTLLARIGNVLESKNQKLDLYFERILGIINHKVPGKVGSRVRFRLQDLIELRMNRWIPRRNYSKTDETVDQTVIAAKTECGNKPAEASAYSELVRNQPCSTVNTSKTKNKSKLKFLFGDSNSNSGSLSGQLNMEQIYEQLLSLMFAEKESSFPTICSWIVGNFGKRAENPEFIEVLMRAILEVSIERYNNTWNFRADKFQNLQALILQYIDVNIELSELRCLITIQEYIHQLEHPQRILLQAIEKQIYERILSFNVIRALGTKEYLTPLSGKAVAMIAIESFFTSLKEANDDSSDDETM